MKADDRHSPDTRVRAAPSAGERADPERNGSGPQQEEGEERRNFGEAGNGKGGNRVQRIRHQAHGLLDDFASWVEVRLQLLLIDTRERIWEEIEDVATQAVARGVLAAAAIVTGVFALLTLALFLGWALGRAVWGFLVVTGLLALVTVVLYAQDRHARAVDARGTADDTDPSEQAHTFSREDTGERNET